MAKLFAAAQLGSLNSEQTITGNTAVFLPRHGRGLAGVGLSSVLDSTLF